MKIIINYSSNEFLFFQMSDSEAVVEKRRGRPSNKSEVIISNSILINKSDIFQFKTINYFYNLQDSVKEPKKRGRETEKKDVAKKDDEVPAKRGRGRPPKSGASGAKKDKPKVFI